MVGGLAYLGMQYRQVVTAPDFLPTVGRKIPTWAMVWVVAGNFEFALFGSATKFIDISVAAALYEIWPLFIIFLINRIMRESRRYRPFTLQLLVLILVCIFGFLFITASQEGKIDSVDISQSTTIIGVSIVVLAALLTSLSAFTFQWGMDLISALPEDYKLRSDSISLELVAAIVATVIANMVSAPINIFIGLFANQTLALDGIVIAFCGGMLANGLPAIFWRKSNLLASNSAINAMAYLIPVVSLVWLALFLGLNVARVDFLIIGAAAIIIANLLINFEAEVRFGFKALILALWGCGAFVYLRDDFLHLLPFDGWLWPRETYLGALGLSATVFILLLTFRVARLGPRTQGEDNRIFALHRNLEMLARRNLIDGSVSEHIRGIDSAHNPEELRAAYTQAKLCFAQAAAVDHPPAERKLLADAEAQLNMVTHSRQQGVDFGELFSLIIFGGSTIALAMLSRPAVEGWVAFLYEVFSVLFSAVVVFLIINVWDLHRERADLVLANRQDSREYGVIFRDPKNRRFEQSVSVVIGLLIIMAYAGLLWNKWLG